MGQHDLFSGIFNDPRSLYTKFYNEYKSFGEFRNTVFTRTFTKTYQLNDESSVLLCYASQYAIAQFLFNQVLTNDLDQPYIDQYTISYLFKLETSETSRTKAFANTTSLHESISYTTQQLFLSIIHSKMFKNMYHERKSILGDETSIALYNNLSISFRRPTYDFNEEDLFRTISYNLLFFFFDHKSFKTISHTNLKATKDTKGLLFKFYDMHGRVVKQQRFIPVSSVQNNRNERNIFIRETNLINDILPTGII